MQPVNCDICISMMISIHFHINMNTQSEYLTQIT